MSVRKEMETILRADWQTIPALAGLRVKATENLPDAIHEDLALVRQQSIGRAPEAPMGVRAVKLSLTIFSAHEDLDRAADALDDYVDAVLDYLPTHVYRHEDAELVKHADRLAYLIPVYVITTKES